jgi:hypothetical protein
MSNEGGEEFSVEEQFQRDLLLAGIFTPYARRQQNALYLDADSQIKPYARFVHYTSAEAALRIIGTKQIWMRNATCMTDYSEVVHGFGMVDQFFSDSSDRSMFVSELETCCPGAADTALGIFYAWWHDIRSQTYIASISEHDEREDTHGRLSMWRAFGGGGGRVAIVLKIPGYSGAARNLNLLFSPVAYLNAEQVRQEILGVIDNIRTNRTFLRSLNQPQVVQWVFTMLLAGVVMP